MRARSTLEPAPRGKPGAVLAFLTVLRARRQAVPMSQPTLPPKKKLPIAKLAIGAAVLAVLGAVVLYLVGWRTVLAEGKMILAYVVDAVAAMGPAVFFGAMALLPALGAPMSLFAIAGGLVFREKLGFPVTVLLGFAALSFNIALTYWLARRWLRPLLTRLLARSGYNLPQVSSADMTDFIVLLRVTPGPPFFVQNYLLGLADAPFGRYMAISCGVQGPIIIGFMVFGEALNQGRGKMILFAVLLIAALVVGIQVLRKHMAKKKVAA
jgi:uncharacterized membrane protein YdjX (TVP38/TMEM64 family)